MLKTLTNVDIQTQLSSLLLAYPSRKDLNQQLFTRTGLFQKSSKLCKPNEKEARPVWTMTLESSRENLFFFLLPIEKFWQNFLLLRLFDGFFYFSKSATTCCYSFTVYFFSGGPMIFRDLSLQIKVENPTKLATPNNESQLLRSQQFQSNFNPYTGSQSEKTFSLPWQKKRHELIIFFILSSDGEYFVRFFTVRTFKTELILVSPKNVKMYSPLHLSLEFT